MNKMGLDEDWEIVWCLSVHGHSQMSKYIQCHNKNFTRSMAATICTICGNRPLLTLALLTWYDQVEIARRITIGDTEKPDVLDGKNLQVSMVVG